MTRYKNSILLFYVKHEYLKNSFFTSSIIEWHNIDSNIRNSESLALSKKRILAFIRPSANSNFHCHNNKGLKLITRLRLGLSHLQFHKFNHSFQHQILSAIVVLLKQLFTTFFIVPIFQMKD